VRKTPLKKISDKQRRKLAEWRLITEQRILQLIDIYGYPICEYCGGYEGKHEFWRLDGHHIDGNRNNNTPENCYIVHRICHSKITDNNIKVKQLDFQGRNN
jgi:hypothetical protein